MESSITSAPYWFKGACSWVPDFAIAKEACRRHDFVYWLGSAPGDIKDWHHINDDELRNNIKELARIERAKIKRQNLWSIIRWFKLRTLDTWIGELYHWGVDVFGERQIHIRVERLDENNPFLRDIYEEEQRENYARD